MAMPRVWTLGLLLLALATVADAFLSPAALPLRASARSSSKCASSSVRMGVLSTDDIPPWAPKFLGSRRLARLIDKNAFVKAQGKLSVEVDAALTKGEAALKSGDKTAAKAGLEEAIKGLEKLGIKPNTSIGLTSLPGRAFELQAALDK
eukprot:CAMPEP_0206241982 /NCGR_PEP_ID=MMETSP0047_2-20121206/16805_1 /ASSEMBLY_ACC=CAM_ASM_000192 /TAXON_ID=195065 /ORGANISM="Chroomonas mesostigmatica_cf, Strain CCMP1168" /LENGTH=148 /DNA_ID=CAMNT_0053666953 /DNA_START=35 /DNA_END=481 /DNA_ORIENTATION=-